MFELENIPLATSLAVIRDVSKETHTSISWVAIPYLGSDIEKKELHTEPRI
jgi:hypothetical protein